MPEPGSISYAARSGPGLFEPGGDATKDQAWANAARRLAKANRKVKWLVAG